MTPAGAILPASVLYGVTMMVDVGQVTRRADVATPRVTSILERMPVASAFARRTNREYNRLA